MRASAGSITRINTNTWRIRVSCGYDPKTVKRIRKTRQIRGSKRDAERVKAEMLLDDNQLLDDRLTLNDITKMYLDEVKEKIRPNTFNGYRKNANKIFTTDIGKIKLCDLDKHEAKIRKWINEGETIGAKSNAYKTLRQVLNFAKKKHLINYLITDFIDEPRSETKEKVTIDTEALPAYLEAVKGSTVEAGVLIMLTCGLRRSEAVGLKWSDIDWDYKQDGCFGRFEVKRGCYYKKGGGVYFDDPKTRQSKRTIALPEWVGVKLHELQGTKTWLCEDYDGEVIRPDRFTKRWLKLIEDAGLPKVLVKNLRHSCGTILVREAGVPISDVQQLLGHTSTQTTETFYVQKSDVSSRRVANAMNNFEPKTGKN